MWLSDALLFKVSVNNSNFWHYNFQIAHIDQIKTDHFYLINQKKTFHFSGNDLADHNWLTFMIDLNDWLIKRSWMLILIKIRSHSRGNRRPLERNGSQIEKKIDPETHSFHRSIFLHFWTFLDENMDLKVSWSTHWPTPTVTWSLVLRYKLSLYTGLQ